MSTDATVVLPRPAAQAVPSGRHHAAHRAGRHAGGHAPWRGIPRKIAKSWRQRKARAELLARYDLDTIGAFIVWNQPARLARVLRGTADLAATGAAGRRAALALLCELNDGLTAIRLSGELRESIRYYPPAAGAR